MSWVVAGTTAAVSVAGGVAAKNQADKALDAQGRQLERNEQFIKDQASRSREDALPLFDAAQISREQGFQGALDVFGETIPQQANVFQQGNVGAQQALLTGQQQQQNAILGLPANLSGFQPQALQFDSSFAQQQLPQAEGFQAAPTSSAVLSGAGESRMGNVLSGINSNEDLFRAASRGEIPNISTKDQKFWRKHLRNVEGGSDGQNDRFVNNSEAALRTVVGVDGGFNPDNERRLAHLVNQFQLARAL